MSVHHPCKKAHLGFILLSLLSSSSNAFTSPQRLSINTNQAFVTSSTHPRINPPKSLSTTTTPPTTSTTIYAENNNKKKKLDEDVKSRLITESIAPWRTLRLFLYFSAGSGAALGGFITLSGVLAAMSGARTDVNFNTEYLNLAIDFGAVLVFALLGKYDFDKGNELNTKVEEKIQQSKDNKVIRKGMKEREQTLAKLSIDIRVSEDTSAPMQRALVEAVQTGGKQHMIIVIGAKKAIRDALLGAQLLGSQFAIRDVLIVPYELKKKKDEEKLKPDVQKGFGGDKRPTWELQPYVAQPAGEEWEEYVQAELNDAIQQNGEKVKDEGIAIVVANTGEIIRRGVGQVPWRNMVEELEKAVKEDDMLDLGFLQG